MSLIDVVGQAFIKSGEKSAAKREAKEQKKEAKTAEWLANVKAVEDWEHALTYVISAKAKGEEAPEWAPAYIAHNTEAASSILAEAHKYAHLSHVNVDPSSLSYNKALADAEVKAGGSSEVDVEARLNALADIFRARTDDARYRDVLIKATVNYGMHRSKALKH
jgi:hypothetical protein